MISNKKPHDLSESGGQADAIFGVMQRCHGNFFCVGGVLVAGISSEFPHIFR